MRKLFAAALLVGACIPGAYADIVDTFQVPGWRGIVYAADNDGRFLWCGIFPESDPNFLMLHNINGSWGVQFSRKDWKLSEGGEYVLTYSVDRQQARKLKPRVLSGTRIMIGADDRMLDQLRRGDQLKINFNGDDYSLGLTNSGKALGELQDCVSRNRGTIHRAETPAPLPAPPSGPAASAKAAPKVATPPNGPSAIKNFSGETKTFRNSMATAVAPKLVENFVDFSFEYPANWTIDPKTGTPEAQNFVTVVRPRENGIDTEKFGVGRLSLSGIAAADAQLIPQLLGQLEAQFAQGFPEFEVVSRGQTTINGISGHESRFQASLSAAPLGRIATIWGRIVILPPPTGTRGVALIMLTTDKAPEIKSAEDIGETGQMPVILNSFKFGA